jgi:cation:H+ antiporter
MIQELILLLGGLLGLWLGSELAIKGARNIAEHFRISSSFIGLTLLSVGTSIPEIALSLTGGIDRAIGIETSGLVIGNAIGSAVNQLTLILGIVGFSAVLMVRKRSLFREGAMLIGIILTIAVLGWDGKLTVIEGYFMVLMYLIYLFNLSKEEKVFNKLVGRKPTMHLGLDSLNLVGGILFVVFASNYVIDSSLALASIWGITQAFVGLFVLGLGTGLPELALSFAALKKREVSMSVSNLIGSNICDLLFSLGIGTSVAGFLMPRNVILFDLPALLLITGLVLFSFRSEYKLTKNEAIMLIAVFFIYLFARLIMFG